jgi:PAS domain S-box-containing protein
VGLLLGLFLITTLRIDGAEARKVRIGVESNSPPLSFIDANRAPAGFSAELLPAVAQEAGIEFEIVINSWAFLTAEFQAGRLDALANVAFSEERRATMDFSLSHSALHGVTYTHPQAPPLRHTAQFRNLKMATLSGTISHAQAVRQRGWGAQIIEFASWQRMLEAVQKGECDFALVTRALKFEQPDELGLHREFVEDIVHPFHIAVHRGDSRLLEQINAALVALQRNGRLNALYEKWIEPIEPHRVQLRDLMPYVTPLALVGVALAAFLVWQQRINRRLNVQSAALRESEIRYRTLVEWSPEPLAIHREGRVLYVNPAAVTLFGADSARDLIGRPAADRIHPDCRTAVVARFEAVARSGQPAPLARQKFLRLDGTTIELEVQSLCFDYEGAPAVYSSARDITERQRAELAFRQQADNYRALVDHLQAGIVVHAPDTSIELSNPMAEQLLGLTKDQMQGKVALDPVWSFINEDGSAVPLADYPVNRVLASGQPLKDLVIGVRRPDLPDSTWLLCSAYPGLNEQGLTGQVVVTFIDLTARKRAEERLRLGDQVLRSISQGVIVARPDGTVVATNAAVSAITGYAEAEILGRNSRFLDGPATDAATIARIDRAQAAHTELSGEMLGYRKDGSTFWNEFTLSPARDQQGRLTHFIWVIRDISDRLRIEREKAEIESQLRQSQKLEAIGQLSGGVAHDFNNLLTAILGNASLLQDEAQSPAERRELLEQINLAATRAASLTHQLLLFSRREELVHQDLDLNLVLGELMKMLRRILGENIDLALDCAAEPQFIRADPGMMSQIVLNLAVNARDAMPRGGKLIIRTATLRFDAPAGPDANPVWTGPERRKNPDARPREFPAFGAATVTANRKRPGTFTCLTVIDEGVGMTPAIMEHIFEPFFTTKEVGRGTGLGLATVYGIVQQHEGWIEVESQPGGGSTFRVYLPRLPAALPPTAPVAAPAAEPLSTGSGELILVVEDESAVGALLTMVLERAGYEVRCCESGAVALTVWPECKSRVRLLVTDLVMPGGVSGVELARRLRAERPDLRVIAMSGYSATLTHDRADLGPATAFIPKPFEINRILDLVHEQLTLARGSGAPFATR